MSTSMLVTDIDTVFTYPEKEKHLKLRVESDVIMPLEDVAKAIGETRLVSLAFEQHGWDTLESIAAIVDTEEFTAAMGESACHYPPGAGAAHNATEEGKAEMDKWHRTLTERHRSSVLRIEEAMRRIREHWEADDIDSLPFDDGDQ